MDVDTDVDYDIADVIETDKSVVDVVEFHTECSNCGHEHDFSKKFTVGTVDKNGNSHYKDVDTHIKRCSGQNNSTKRIEKANFGSLFILLSLYYCIYATKVL